MSNHAPSSSSGPAKYDLETTRRIIKTTYFDPSNYIGQQISAISIDGTDPEIKLFQIFEELTEHLTQLSEGIEDEVRTLQCEASNTEAMLMEDLDDQLDKLEQVGEELDLLKYNFDLSSEGAMSIGGKLSTFERERNQVTKSIELLAYIQYFEEHADRYQSNIINQMNAERLKSILPGKMSTMNWDEISRILHDLNRVMTDMNKPEVENSQQIIISITEIVETELLGQFDNILHELMENATNLSKISKAKSLASTLHLFNNGLALQKRYIFSVIQKRIPSDAFFTGGNNTVNNKESLLNKFKSKFIPGQEGGDYGDDDSSAGASQNNSDNEEDESLPIQSKQQTGPSNFIDNLKSLADIGGNNQTMSSFQLLDHLSGLFTMINRVCLEQFDIIRQVFPAHTIARVTRLLVQRIFSDPAFGIQARVDAILCPQPPAPPLLLSDYLDALLTVREKLTALNLILIDCTSDASMIGMGSESASLRKSKKEMAYYPSNSPNGKGASRSKGDNGNNSSKLRLETIEEDHSEHGDGEGKTQDEIDEERIRSDAEIREFFDEQIAQVLGNYVAEYFDKEITHVRQQYVALLRKAVDDATLVSSGTVLNLPHLKAEKIKSVSHINKSITKNLVKGIFAVTTDAVCRMESIGRDDKKKLPIYLKELCLLQLGFLNDGIFMPALKQATNLLLKTASSIYKQQSLAIGGPNGSGNAFGSIISYDVLDFLAVLCYYREEFANNFQNIFQRPLLDYPNLLVICKDTRKESFKAIIHHSKETLYAWEVGIVLYLEKTLSSIQSKFDFAPKFDPLATLSNNVNHAMAVVEGNLHNHAVGNHNQPGNHMSSMGNSEIQAVLSPTTACDAVCKIIIGVTQSVRARDGDMTALDMDHIYWKPFGQQFIAILIAHFRKFKVSQLGAKQILRDLEEYRLVAQLMNSAETLDMVICLEEICRMFLVPADQVAKMVMEEMRHLDTAIVLALVKCRSDFSTRNQSDQYTKILGSTYSNFKWDAALAWEGKKPLTVMAFNDAFSLILSNAANPTAANSNANQHNHYIRVLGPKSLRKSSAMPLSAFFLNEMANRTRGDSSDHGGLKDSIRVSQSGAMSIDINALESAKNPYDLDRHARMLSSDGNNPNLATQFSPMTQKLISKYLPSRPDEEMNLRDMTSPDVSSKRISSVVNSTSVLINTPQVSRPDLIGIADNRASVVTNKKRPQTTGVSGDYLSTPSKQGVDLPPMPSQGNRSSMANPSNSTSVTSGRTDSTATPKAETKSMFKTVSGFFKGF